MSKIESELHNRFHNQQLPNDGFDAEGLWDAIAEEMDHHPSTPLPFTFLRKWKIGLILLLLIGGLLAMLWPSDRLDSGTEKIAHTTKEYTQLLAPSSTLTPPVKAEQAEAALQSITPSHQNTINTNTSSSSFKSDNTQKDIIPTTISPSSISSTQRTLSPITTAKSHKNKTPIQTINQDSIQSNSSMSTLKKQTYPGAIAESSVLYSSTLLKRISSKSSLVSSDQTFPPILSFSTIQSPIAPSKGQPVWQLKLLGGPSLIQFSYQNKNNSDWVNSRANTEERVTGMATGIHISRQLKRNWYLSSGIEYHALWSKFDFEQEKAIRIYSDEQLIKIWIDGTTGDTLNKLRDTLLIDATSTRTVVHYNQYRMLSLPLGIRFQKQAKRLIYGLEAGLAFNFTLSQSGKTLDPMAEIISFDDGDPYAPLRSFNLGWQVSPIIGYQLAQNWAVTLQPQWMRGQNRTIADTNVKMHFHRLSLNLGLAFTLK